MALSFSCSCLYTDKKLETARNFSLVGLTLQAYGKTTETTCIHLHQIVTIFNPMLADL